MAPISKGFWSQHLGINDGSPEMVKNMLNVCIKGDYDILFNVGLYTGYYDIEVVWVGFH